MFRGVGIDLFDTRRLERELALDGAGLLRSLFTPDEVAACRGYLDAQIDAIRPDVLVCLGRVAARTLLGSDAPIGRTRGQWFKVRGVATMVTYHPAALLRNEALKRPTWEDMQQVRERLRETAEPR